MFTAIVLNEDSAMAVWRAALALDLIRAGCREFCHHVTLAMGAPAGFNIGESRTLTVTHYGETAGRVTAFRVAGADDSANKVPHLTVTTFGDAKPKESNEISAWVEIPPFEISGTVTVCK